MTGLRAAIVFLTRVPAGSVHDQSSAVPWFPVVAAVVGALSGAGYVAASAVTIPIVAAAVAVGVAVAVTGAFHEDGLADTFDGLSSIRSVERQLEIMRDSRLGTFGVVALALVLISRVGAVSALPASAGTVLVIAWLHALAASVVIGVMVVARPAAVDGSGAEHLNRMRVPASISVAIVTCLAGWFVISSALVTTVLVSVLGPLVVVTWAHRRIGGVTGDVLGACQQLALVGGLAIVAL